MKVTHSYRHRRHLYSNLILCFTFYGISHSLLPESPTGALLWLDPSEGLPSPRLCHSAPFGKFVSASMVLVDTQPLARRRSRRGGPPRLFNLELEPRRLNVYFNIFLPVHKAKSPSATQSVSSASFRIKE